MSNLVEKKKSVAPAKKPELDAAAPRLKNIRIQTLKSILISSTLEDAEVGMDGDTLYIVVPEQLTKTPTVFPRMFYDNYQLLPKMERMPGVGRKHYVAEQPHFNFGHKVNNKMY